MLCQSWTYGNRQFTDAIKNGRFSIFFRLINLYFVGPEPEVEMLFKPLIVDCEDPLLDVTAPDSGLSPLLDTAFTKISCTLGLEG